MRHVTCHPSDRRGQLSTATENEAAGIGTTVRIWYHDIVPGNVQGNDVRFTFRWQDTDQWDTTDYRVTVQR